jgi:hypothetical protein
MLVPYWTTAASCNLRTWAFQSLPASSPGKRSPALARFNQFDLLEDIDVRGGIGIGKGTEVDAEVDADIDTDTGAVVAASS